MFPANTAKRADFEQLVRKVDEMFYSEENAKIWCLGVEGVTYKMDGDKIVYDDKIVNAPNGIFKQMQVDYGCGANGTQQVWLLDYELTKYDDNFKKINEDVAAMKDSIQSIPPAPAFDDMAAEDAASLSTPLADKFEAGREIGAQDLWNAGLIRSASQPVKVLAKGEPGKAFTLKVNAVSAGARAKIEAAGGKVEVI